MNGRCNVGSQRNHLCVRRRKPDMLENIWYTACPEEKRATVASTKWRCSFFFFLSIPMSVNLQHRQQVMHAILTGWVRTQDCFASLFIKWNLVRSPCHFCVCTKREWWRLALLRSFFFYDCTCMPVLMFVCTCVQISEVSSGAVLTL